MQEAFDDVGASSSQVHLEIVDEVVTLSPDLLLDEILDALQQLDDPRVYQDVSELQRLQSVVAEGLKRFEFGLRRQSEADANTIVLSGSDEVPEEFRQLVQEYYRSLARTPQ